jgi:hypothetical protein
MIGIWYVGHNPKERKKALLSSSSILTNTWPLWLNLSLEPWKWRLGFAKMVPVICPYLCNITLNFFHQGMGFTSPSLVLWISLSRRHRSSDAIGLRNLTFRRPGNLYPHPLPTLPWDLHVKKPCLTYRRMRPCEEIRAWTIPNEKLDSLIFQLNLPVLLLLSDLQI